MKKKIGFKSGFTLAEIIISMTILGIIAAIVIPATLKNTTTRTHKAKLSKALEIYDKAINNMMIENGLQRSAAALSEYAYKDDTADQECVNIRRYFKVQQGDGCSFKGVDGLWWDFGHQNGQFNITRVRVAFKQETMQDIEEATGNGYNAFVLVTNFDSKGNLRINDVAYENVSGSDETRQETQKVIAFLEGRKNFEWDNGNGNGNGNGDDPDQPIIQPRFCIGDWCFIDDRIINIPQGSMCQRDLLSNGSWKTECVQGEAREICAMNDATAQTTCGYCITNPDSFACRRGGYYCAQVDSTHMECHINGGMVSDITYDKNGCVTYVRCNSWNDPCNNGGAKEAKKQCKTALCSYKNGQWVTDASDLDKEFFDKFVEDWTTKTGGNREACEN